MDEKWSKVIVHASAFFAPVIVPVLFMLISSDEHVKRLSVQALLFQFVMWVMVGISAFFSVILIGLPFLLVFSVIGIAVPIIGIVKAVNDSYWNYPVVGRFV